MNNNIQKLMHKCYIENSQDQYDMEKFAELIVQECIAMCDEAREKYFDAQVRTDNFSEKNIHASGGVACKNIGEQIAEHFGV